jgi:hypothetical protein
MFAEPAYPMPVRAPPGGMLQTMPPMDMSGGSYGSPVLWLSPQPGLALCRSFSKKKRPFLFDANVDAIFFTLF